MFLYNFFYLTHLLTTVLQTEDACLTAVLQATAECLTIVLQATAECLELKSYNLQLNV